MRFAMAASMELDAPSTFTNLALANRTLHAQLQLCGAYIHDEASGTAAMSPTKGERIFKFAERLTGMVAQLQRAADDSTKVLGAWSNTPLRSLTSSGVRNGVSLEVT